MTFLLLLIIIFFVLPPLVARLARWYLKYKTKQFFDRMSDAASQGFNAKSGNSASHRPAKRKKIGKDVGEYVEFEEIAVTQTTSTTQTADGQSTTVSQTEEQITDAVWEDVV